MILIASRTQVAWRSRLSTSPRSRMHSTAPKNNMNPSNIDSNGHNMLPGMAGLPSLATVAP